MTRQNTAQTKLTRLGQVLRIFMERENVSSAWLGRQLQATPRTIQRDLLLLKASGFPLHEIRKGVHTLSKDLVKSLEVFDDTELALVVALKNMVGQLGEPFRQAADGVMERLYDCVAAMPVFVKIDDAVVIDSTLLKKVIKAIRERKQAIFRYPSGRKDHPVSLEPYRVVYFDGFWYLVGNEVGSGILKRYALDKIREFKATTTVFRGVPETLDALLQQSANAWFTKDNPIEVVIAVDPICADYFKRRKMYPTQEIREEKPDGSVTVAYRIGHYEAIRSMLKSWIPHIRILEPNEFRESFLAEIREWVLQQEAES